MTSVFHAHAQTSYVIIYTLVRQKKSKEPEVAPITIKEGSSGMRDLGTSEEATTSSASMLVILINTQDYFRQLKPISPSTAFGSQSQSPQDQFCQWNTICGC